MEITPYPRLWDKSHFKKQEVVGGSLVLKNNSCKLGAMFSFSTPSTFIVTPPLEVIQTSQIKRFQKPWHFRGMQVVVTLGSWSFTHLKEEKWPITNLWNFTPKGRSFTKVKGKQTYYKSLELCACKLKLHTS